MFKTVKVKLFLVSSLIITLALVFSSTNMIAEQGDPFSEIKDKMSGISQKEKETLQKLFTQEQEIEAMERDEKEIARNIEITKGEIGDLQRTIAGEETAYAKGRENLKQVLQCYQRMGPGSYLEIILKSTDLSDLLKRINTLRDLTRNTGTLLDQITKNKERLSAEKTKLAEKLVLVEDKQEQLVQALTKKKQLKEDMEHYLASLAEERGHYQEYLNSLQLAWGELKPFFSNTAKALSSTIEKDNLPEDALKITYKFLSVKVSIDEKTLNDIIAGDPQLPKMVFSFHPGKVEMKVPDKNLILTGKFVIVDGHSLKFEVEEGSFYGMPLEIGAIKELFQEGYLELNLESKLDGFTLKSVEIMDGYLNLSI